MAIAGATTQQPKLFIYDFCPFCCRARVALGLKKVKYDVIFMAYDDEATPRSLVGVKAAQSSSPWVRSLSGRAGTS